jgi:hypothetical protein
MVRAETPVNQSDKRFRRQPQDGIRTVDVYIASQRCFFGPEIEPVMTRG